MIRRIISAILMFAILGSPALACQFEPGEDCSGVNLEGVDLWQLLYEGQGRYDLQGIIFRGANLKNANLINFDFEGANFQDAILSAANLKRADLTGANLKYAALNNTDLTEASFLNANLEGANLRLAKIAGTFFLGTNLKGARLGGATEFTEGSGGLTVHSPAHFEGATFK